MINGKPLTPARVLRLIKWMNARGEQPSCRELADACNVETFVMSSFLVALKRDGSIVGEGNTQGRRYRVA